MNYLYLSDLWEGQEVWDRPSKPTFAMDHFIFDPANMQALHEMTCEGIWTDVGGCSSQWGAHGNLPTRHARAKASQSTSGKGLSRANALPFLNIEPCQSATVPKVSKSKTLTFFIFMFSSFSGQPALRSQHSVRR